MIIIAHRGNLNGIDENEHSPLNILRCLKSELDVEIDAHWYNDELWMGHDKPVYKCPPSYLTNKHIWFHAKDLESLEFLVKINAHVFWQQKDEYTITSKGFLWAFSNQHVTSDICIHASLTKSHPYSPVMKDISPTCYGICTDYPLLLKQMFKE